MPNYQRGLPIIRELDYHIISKTTNRGISIENISSNLKLEMGIDWEQMSYYYIKSQEF